MKARMLGGFTALAVAAATAASTGAPALAAGGTPTRAPAQPAPASASNLSAAVAPSWQTNNTVWALAYHAGVVYVGGSFTSVRPPGNRPGTGEAARSYLAAFDSSTGALLPFHPVLDGQVTALAVHDTTLYVGGDFTHVGTTSRQRLAAFSTGTGNLVSAWKPAATGSVLAIAPSPDGSTIYVGGNFNKLDGTARSRAGAVDGATGTALSAWNPAPNGTVTSIAVAPDDSRVLVGGYFSTLNGAAQQAVGATDPATGSSRAFPSIEPSSGCTAAVKDILIGSVSGSNPAGVAYIASEGTGTGCFDGDWAASVSTGALLWQNDCLGATQALAIVGGWLYKGSHAHDCAFAPGGFPEINPTGTATGVGHRLLNQSLADGSLGHWTPDTNGHTLGPRVMATDGSQLFVGGDFTRVNNQPQQGFARFGPGPDTARPPAPGPPSVISTSRGADSVTVAGVSTPDVGTLTYMIYRDHRRTPIGTVTATSWPWALPVVHYRDAGLQPGSHHTYRAAVTDGVSNSAKSPASAPVTVSATSPGHTYFRTVLRDQPSLFWKLNESSGAVAADSSPHQFNGSYGPGTALGAPGPITGATSTAVSFNGQTGLVTSARSLTSPQEFSIEGWFKTSTNTGGKLFGFGSAPTGSSSTYDRHVFMLNDGQLAFGVWTGRAEAIETPAAYNDGQWHYVVATFRPTSGGGRMALYVDGARIGKKRTRHIHVYAGYWRVGGDNLTGWTLDPRKTNSQGTTEPNSFYFGGTIGDVAVYPNALSAGSVAAHYAANALSH